MCELPEVKHHGLYPQEALPSGWSNAEVICFNRNGAMVRLIEILDLNTQVLYPQEPLKIIALKCAGLFLVGIPFYFLFYSTIQLIRVITVPIVNVAPLSFFREFWHAVKLPFYFIGMQFAALYGIFRPLEGRALFASIESSLHDGKGRKNAEQMNKEKDAELVWELFGNENPKRALFVAICMQPLGRGDDPLIHVRELQNPLVS